MRWPLPEKRSRRLQAAPKVPWAILGSRERVQASATLQGSALTGTNHDGKFNRRSRLLKAKSNPWYGNHGNKSTHKRFWKAKRDIRKLKKRG